MVSQSQTQVSVETALETVQNKAMLLPVLRTAGDRQGVIMTRAAPMKIRLDHVTPAETGDYFQVLFEAGADGDGAYVLIQRQFEDPDSGRCYIETHDDDYIGYFDVVRASLARNRFCLELRRAHSAKVEVTFETTGRKYGEVAKVMRIMIPCLEIVGAREAS